MLLFRLSVSSVCGLELGGFVPGGTLLRLFLRCELVGTQNELSLSETSLVTKRGSLMMSSKTWQKLSGASGLVLDSV